MKSGAYRVKLMNYSGILHSDIAVSGLSIWGKTPSPWIPSAEQFYFYSTTFHSYIFNMLIIYLSFV